MPTINKLGKPAATAKPESDREAVTLTADDVGTVNATALIESKDHSPDFKSAASRVKLPGFLTKAMPETSEREVTGYVGFCSEASKNYPEQQASGLNDGDIFLNHQGQFIKCPQLEFFLAAGESFKTVMDQSGKFVGATRNVAAKELKFKIGTGPRAIERTADGYSNPKLEPHYVCLCIVNLNGRLIPIKGDFRGTKSGGIETAISAVRAAGDAGSGWLRLSDAHKATAAFPEPFGRVYHIMRAKPEVAKTSGKAYTRSITVSGPAKIDQMGLLLEALQNEDFNKTLEEAYKNYQARVEFIDKVCRGENPYDTQ